MSNDDLQTVPSLAPTPDNRGHASASARVAQRPARGDSQRFLELVILVRQMRQAQRDYFATRSSEVLRQSMALERQVDAALATFKTA